MKALLFIFTLLVLLSCSQKAQNSRKISTLFKEYWDEHARLFPIDATQQGDNRYNDIITNDQTQEFRAKLDSFHEGYLKRLKEFKRDELDENDRISYDIFEYEMEMQLKTSKLDLWKIPFQQFWGLPLYMGQLGAGTQFQPFKTVKDYENWLGRLRDFKLWSESAVVNFSEGMKSDWVLPKVLVKKMIPQFKAFVVKDPKESLFYDPIKNMPKEFPAEEKVRLTNLYVKAISEDVIPTYKLLHDFLKDIYLPKARKTHGISSLPNGRENYNALVAYWTTTNLTSDEIHQIGLKEVARIRAEMEKVRKAVGYKGSLKSFFSHLRTDKKLMPYKTPEEVLGAFYDIHKKMIPQLKTMFGRVPKTPFEIRQTEAFRAATASAEYSPGSPDGSRPGIFYLPILDAKKFNITSGMESLFLHEAIPGHHYQISLQQENTTIPDFRRFSWYGAYGEGWALYTESLGKELGLYTNPYQYMGSLSDEMHRAVRLVVDTGIHTKGMTREQAINYLLSNEPIPEKDAVAEVERYMAIPGQALSYKIGALKIWDLRNKYQTKLGSKFKLSDFHDEFLKDGCMPLAIVEKKMDDWAEVKNK